MTLHDGVFTLTLGAFVLVAAVNIAVGFLLAYWMFAKDPLCSNCRATRGEHTGRPEHGACERFRI